MNPAILNTLRVSASATIVGIILICASTLAHAGTTLVFEDNLNPSSPYPSTNPTDTGNFLPSTEFRVVLNGAVSGGGMKSIIGAANATGGAAPTPPNWDFTTWVFDNNNRWTNALNTATTPGSTIPTNGGNFSAAPGGDTGMAQNAAFLGSPFGFLATTVGSAAGNAYGLGEISFSGGSSFNIRVGVTEAQWASGTFTIGMTQGGVDFIGSLQSNKHSFRIVSETVIQPSDDSLGFSGQNTQWDLVGNLNSDPSVKVDNYLTEPTLPKTILVTEMATDREGDTMTISTPAPVVTGTAGGTANCTTNSCTYTPVGIAGTDTFTVTVDDDFAAVPGSSDITITMVVSEKTTAIDDNPSNNPGTIINQNSTDNAINLTDNDKASPGETIDPDSIQIVSPPSNGSITMPLPNDGTGTILYTPNSGFSGSDSFTYEVDDTKPETSNIATVDVKVNCTETACAAGGPVIPGGGFTTIRLTVSDLISAGIGADDGVDGVGVSCDPDCFSFKAPTASPAVVVFTLSGPIKEESKYRKVDGQSWTQFDTTTGDTVLSAPGSLGVCPPPGDPEYTAGLLSGRFCIQLTIEDGGPNDDDGVAGQVSDPSGIGSGSVEPVVLPGKKLSSNPGCSIVHTDIKATRGGAWWLLAGFLAYLGWMMHRRSKQS